MKIKINFILIMFLSGFINGQTTFSKEQVFKDLSYLKKALIEAQFNIYESVSEDTFEKGYLEIKNKINKDSYSLLEATKVLQQLPVIVNNGHTSIDFPGSEYMKYASSNDATIFPIEIAIENNRALVRKNWSNNKHLKPGDEVLSINNKPINSIFKDMYAQISGEHNMMKNVKIEMYSFPRYYWQLYGQINHFEVQIKNLAGNKTYQVAAVKVMDEYEDRRSEVLNSTMNLKFYDDIAYLNPGSFGGDLHKFKNFIKSSFEKIKSHESQTLIIDLRNNAGGDNDYSDFMLSFIANTPFTWNSSFQIRTSKLLKESGKQNENSNSKYWKSIFSHTDGERFDYDFIKTQPQPKEKRFTGEVYALVNRQSHSQATVTAAQIQDYKLGTIFGEETAEYPSLIASVFYFKLPNTKILVQISKGKMIRVNGSTKEEGVIPDIFIKDFLLDEKDEILTELLNRLRNQK